MGKNNMKRLLVVDALNMYFRAYIVDPSLSSNGQPIGGLKGFLKILQKLCRETKPDGVVIVWDGAGGSKKRKLVNKNYKEGRKPIRLNRDIKNMSESEEIANKIWQQTRLFEYLNNLPIIQLVSENVEADDVVSFVVQNSRMKGKQKIIVSSDKDFYQLLDDETVLFRPVQKEVLNKNRIVERHGIHPTNFALARAICGDKSDNLEGVGSAGLKTIAKRFPFLAEDKTYEIDDVIDFSKEAESRLKVYDNIVEKQDLVKENYKLMQLYAPSISVQSKTKINYILDNFEPEFNKTEMLKMMTEDGFGEYNWSGLFQTMKRFVVDKF